MKGGVEGCSTKQEIKHVMAHCLGEDGERGALGSGEFWAVDILQEQHLKGTSGSKRGLQAKGLGSPLRSPLSFRVRRILFVR